MTRIICMGNALVASDRAGPLVYDHLLARGLPGGVELVDGGLGGLGLLRFVEGMRRVVFVDALDDTLPASDTVVQLDPDAVAALANGALDHAAGLPYLLRALPVVLDAPLPSLSIVGIRGTPEPDSIARAARLAVHLATEPGPEVSP